MSYTQVLTTVLHSPVKKRAQVSPVIYVLLGGLVLYFMWRDVDLLVTLRKCDNRNVTQDLTVTSVKSLLQPPTIHYIELPLSEIMAGLSFVWRRQQLKQWRQLTKRCAN